MTNGDVRRVITGLRHGGHAIVDGAAGAAAAVQGGDALLSEVSQEPAIEGAGLAQARAMVCTTDFDYLFPGIVDDPAKHLPADNDAEVANTVAQLNALGAAMIEQPDGAPSNSPIPPVHTYWGQFVDHDLTAATDNDTAISIRDEVLPPLPADEVRAKLKNARQPALNLDSLYGDGPFAPPPALGKIAVPYQEGDRAKLAIGTLTPTNRGVRIPPVDDMARDLPRNAGKVALIGDGRNDENLIVAQLHLAFLRFHNAAVDWVRANEPERAGVGAVFRRARDLTRWAYQWITIHDFLATVTASGTVDEVHDEDLLGLADRDRTYMPLEFSVAAYRFGHSMVRGAYDWNRNFGRPGNNGLPTAPFGLLFLFTGTGGLGGDPTLPTNWPVEWDRLVDPDSLFADRFARRIDTQLAPPLADMVNQVEPGMPPGRIADLLKHLARRNLLRGYRLRLPTGQAAADALGITPMDKDQLTAGLSQGILDALTTGAMLDRTPLWFYVLREAEVLAGGNTLGPVGSRIVAATIIDQVRHDPTSYMAQPSWSPAAGVRLPDGSPVTSIRGFLRFAGVL